MKVLTTPKGQTLTVSMSADTLITLDGKTKTLEGIVADVQPGLVRAEAMAAGVDDKYGMLKAEVNEVKRFSKNIAAYEVGDKVVCKATSRGLAIPSPSRPEVSLEVGDVCVFNETVSPRYMLNTRVTITEVLGGGKVRYTLDEGDLTRLRKSGKTARSGNGRGPSSILDKVGA